MTTLTLSAFDIFENNDSKVCSAMRNKWLTFRDHPQPGHVHLGAYQGWCSEKATEMRVLSLQLPSHTPPLPCDDTHTSRHMCFSSSSAVAHFVVFGAFPQLWPSCISNLLPAASQLVLGYVN